MLGFLRRNLKVCSVKIKDLTYKALIQPITEYASHSEHHFPAPSSKLCQI